MKNVSNRKQKKTAEPNVTPASTDWRERLELCLGFLRFHSKQIVGFILVCAVAALVYKLSNSSQEALASDNGKKPKSALNSELSDPRASLGSSQSHRDAPPGKI